MDSQLIKPYNRTAALAYAKKWSYRRNPAYYDFSGIGGDCTNFISQCVYAGSQVMNDNPYSGWYYISASSRSASWAGVNFFYEFITSNQGPGPFAKEVTALSSLEIGDVIQFGDQVKGWHHSLLVVQAGNEPSKLLVATHSFDAYRRPLDTYVDYSEIRYLHIEGVRNPS